MDDMGMQVTVEYVTTTYDPATGADSETITQVDVMAAPPTRYTEEEPDGSVVLSGSLLDVPGRSLAVAPSTADRVVIDGDTWAITEVERKFVNDEIGLYRLHIGR